MNNHIGQISLLVRDYDEAIEYYTRVLAFKLIEDTELSKSKRWVVIGPDGDGPKGCNLLLAQAASESQLKQVGFQTGGRVFLFLYTTDFDQFYQHLMTNEVEIINGPRIESYGKVLVFKDLYGNLWDLIHRNY